MKKKLLIVAGANGFLGRSLIENYNKKGTYIIGLTRNQILDPRYYNHKNIFLKTYQHSKHSLGIPEIIDDLNLKSLSSITIVNAAGPAHKKKTYKDMYNDGIIRFTEIIANDSLKINANLINISSISARESVNNNANRIKEYGLAKFKAEKLLDEVFRNNKGNAISLRFPAVWGIGAPGSFAIIQKAINKKLPLPITSIRAKRAYINIKSVTGIIYNLDKICQEHSFDKHLSFEVSDGDFTLLEIAEMISEEMQEKLRHFTISEYLIKITLKVLMPTLYLQIFEELSICNTEYKTFLEYYKLKQVK